MKYALVNGIKEEAKKGLIGYCPLCGEELVAKCGNYRINHWAHKSKQNCDSWWENETEWHRNWKNKFPVEWQEKIFTDDLSGEKHFADICTDNNLIIEFQHSNITPEEQTSRENFYKNMVWVVDGTRLKNDFPRFCKGKFYKISEDKENEIYLCKNPYEILPKSWQKSKVPVFLDFLGQRNPENVDNDCKYLYCIIPMGCYWEAFIIRMTREMFINNVINNSIMNNLEEFINISKIISKKIEQDMLKSQYRPIRLNYNNFPRHKNYFF